MGACATPSKEGQRGLDSFGFLGGNRYLAKILLMPKDSGSALAWEGMRT